MNMPPTARASIRDSLGSAPEGPPRFLWGATASVRLDHLLNGTTLGGRAAEVAGRSVLIGTRDHFSAALVLIELDGIARRLTLCTPDVASGHLPAVVAKAGVDAIVSDHDRGDDGLGITRLLCDGIVTPARELQARCRTEWALLTSGTTGSPKILIHSFASLTAHIGRALGQGTDVVWGTFYDIRRYG